jgi:uncharacterized phage protein (TIGR02220 family)
MQNPFNMTGYTKLFGSIVDSTIWRESKETKVVWITMLAKANRDGIVEASMPGLADAARVTLDECESALKCLMSPDKHSRTKDYEGRRIEPVDGGWLVLNHAKYRAKMNADERREYFRLRKQKERMSNKCPQMSNIVNDSQKMSAKSHIAEADSEAKEIKNSNVVLIINRLNEKTGRKFRECDSNLSLIRARLSENGVSVDGCIQMIDRQVSLWKGTNMEEYLRPSTLFGKEKFDSYYASKDVPIKNSGNATPRRTYVTDSTYDSSKEP